MPYDLSNRLVIGIASSALFDLRAEDRIFRTEGLQAFIDYQRAHEQEVLPLGAAFPLIQGLLGLNARLRDRKVDVILMSRNHPDVSLRVFHSIRHHRLDITRAALTGGASLGPYLAPFNLGLFLSQNTEDVQSAANQGFAAGLIYSPPPELQTAPGQIRIAFDGDCVIFSDEAQKIYEEQDLEAFRKHEEENADIELPAGPFAKILRTLAEIQGSDPNNSPVRIALVTDRNMPAHERAIRTLRKWNVRIDEAFFLGGIAKTEILKAFGAHMFFDDKEEHCKPAAEKVPTGRVLRPRLDESEIQIDVSVETEGRFLHICRSYLKSAFPAAEAELKAWYQVKLQDWPDASRSALLAEFRESALGTPRGNERRAANEEDSPKSKLISFLDKLASKYFPK